MCHSHGPLHLRVLRAPLVSDHTFYYVDLDSGKSGTGTGHTYKKLGVAFMYEKMATDDICKGVDPKSLKSRISDFHITEIAADLTDWEDIAPFLGLTDAEVMEIKEDHPDKPRYQRHKALCTWQWKNRDSCTYEALVHMLCSPQVQQVALAERVVKMLTSPDEFKEGSRRHVTTYRKRLIDTFRNVQHPSCDQWPTISSDMSRCGVYVDLKLHESPWSEFMISAQKEPHERSSSKAVSLGDVFGSQKEQGKREGREVVVFEGVAGSGKTTLCWHLRREWAKGHFLQQFHLLIHAHLSDPQLQSATTLDDFIVNAEKKEQEEVTSYIRDRKGEGICFLFDGLDEALPSLLNSVFELIKGKYRVRLPNLSFIMTTRPNSRIIAEMKQVVKSRRILIDGFEIPKLHDFIDLCLESLPSKKQVAHEKFTIHPAIEHLCTLPVNAVIMTHMIQSVGDSVPSNMADLYHFIVSNFLVRHMCLRTSQKAFSRAFKPTDLDSLPSQIQSSFKQMCLLAYSATIQKGTVISPLFMAAEVGIPPQEEVDNSLGLLCIHSRITMMGETRYFRFSYPSLQDYLTAIHVLNMSSHDQVSAKNGLPPSVLELIELSSV